MMDKFCTGSDHANAIEFRSSIAEAEPLGLFTTLVVSAWCGLVAGLVEVATIVVRKTAFDANHLYDISRDFVWLIPVINLGLFLGLGILNLALRWAWPRAGHWLFARALCALLPLPAFLIASPRIYTLGWLAVTLGIAMRLVPVLDSNRRSFARIVRLSLPPALGILLVLAASPWVNDQLEQSREMARASPPQGSPNVLLIVLDTVAASHLSLYGYERPTSKSLVELAERGFRFDCARAPSSWTLPSHATMFTGRWMHELSVGWLNPLDNAKPTLAEYMREHGFATTGFVANTMFCGRSSGLSRGFTYYEDFIFPEWTVIKTAVLANRTLGLFGRLLSIIEARSSLAWMRPSAHRLWRSLVNDRKGAASVNREFLRWLSRRAQPGRPFFAFLNYYDAHTPYELLYGRIHRFGAAPSDERQRELIKRWGELDKVRVSPKDLPFVVDAYDDCIADLDEQIGRLLDKLGRQRVLDQTWLIIASDHGESFGEHPGVFCHGTSLYQTELHVPLLIVPPGGTARPRVVKNTVSLRDLPATVIDVLGLQAGSPLPGNSLARYWRETSPAGETAHQEGELALSEVVPGLAINVDAYGLPHKAWPLGALDDGDWSYIRSEQHGEEELFHVSTDRKEQYNLARDPATRPVLAACNRCSQGSLAAPSCLSGSIAEAFAELVPVRENFTWN